MLFNFLGRDFFNALSQKDAERFTQMLFKWLGGIALGVPVFVYRDYLQVRWSHHFVLPSSIVAPASVARSMPLGIYTDSGVTSQSPLAVSLVPGVEGLHDKEAD